MFENDIAVVTGGTRGIGRAIVERFASGGATVVATYHGNEAAAEQTEQMLAEFDAESRVVQFDVADFEAVQGAFDDIADEIGYPTILVNNAGTMRNGLLIRMQPEEWERVLSTNLTGTFHCTREAARYMLRGDGGRIVNVSSIAGQRGWAGQANYAASKAGVIGFTRSVARELAGKSIRVNAVCPGYTRTDLYEGMVADAGVDPETDIPQERIADPEEIADTIAFLASDRSSYTTGAVVRVDGGLLA